jgi:hypothetical protein
MWQLAAVALLAHMPHHAQMGACVAHKASSMCLSGCTASRTASRPEQSFAASPEALHLIFVPGWLLTCTITKPVLLLCTVFFCCCAVDG